MSKADDRINAMEITVQDTRDRIMSVLAYEGLAEISKKDQANKEKIEAVSNILHVLEEEKSLTCLDILNQTILTNIPEMAKVIYEIDIIPVAERKLKWKKLEQ